MSRSDAEIIELAKLFHEASPEERKALLNAWQIEAKKVRLDAFAT